LPLLLRERLWWLETGTSTLDNPSIAVHLVSVREDGNDRRDTPLLNGSDTKGLTQVFLETDGARLYFLTAEIGENPDFRAREQYAIYAVRPNAAGYPLGPRCPIPPEAVVSSFGTQIGTENDWFAHVENGWLYYLARDDRKSPVDFLFEQSTQ